VGQARQNVLHDPRHGAVRSRRGPRRSASRGSRWSAFRPSSPPPTWSAVWRG